MNTGGENFRTSVAQPATDPLSAAGRSPVESARDEPAAGHETELHCSPLESIPFGVWQCENNGRWSYVNDYFQTYTGWTSDQFQAADWTELMHAEDLPAARTLLANSLRDGLPLSTKVRLRRQDGTFLWFEISTRPVKNSRQEILRWVGTARDVHAEVEASSRAEEARLESERKIRRILDSSAQFMGLLDVEGRLLEANSTSLDFIGKKREEVVGRLYWKTEWWGNLDGLRDSIRDAVRRAAKGATVRMETKHRGADGRMIDVDFSLKPIRDGAGVIVNLLPEARDITDRKRVEMALKEAKESAEAANLSKDRFLAMLSHELRTPLAPVLITVAGMEADPLLPDGVRRDIAMVRRNVELESKLIDDLLDVSKIASGNLPLRRERVDLNELIRQVCAMCRGQALEKKLHLEIRLDPDAGAAIADPARLQQVMWNLLKNAIKFTPDAGTVAVTSFKSTEGRVRFQVRDTGIGIESDALARLFHAFEHGSDRAPQKFGGLGLGLAISKSLIQQHGGTITVESPGRGGGTTFNVDLPAATPAAPAPNPDDHAAAPARGAHLLLVEDHDDTALALAKFLRHSGFNVKRAATAATALELLSNQKFDLVMSDIGLPDLPGYELMKEIRQRWKTPGIAMSGFGMEEDIRKSRESGFSEHLVKPVKLSVLEEIIHRLLQPT